MDSGDQPTKKSEEKVYVPLVVFNHYGARGSHSVTPADRINDFKPAREGDVAPRRAKKKTTQPMYMTGLYYKKKRKK
jgi:hypothetical protein